jgi:hypothetical protein
MDLNFRNRAVLDLPMRMAQHDATNLRTLDISPTGAHATFGDGVTPASYPTKMDYKRGYSCGENILVDERYFVGSAAGVLNTAEISIVLTFRPSYLHTDPYVRFLFDTSNAPGRYYLAKLSNVSDYAFRVVLGDTLVADISKTVYGPAWNRNQQNQLVVSGTSGNTNAWLNSHPILTNDATAWTPDNPANYYLGAWNGLSGDTHSGDWYGCQVYPFMLSSLQVASLYIDMMKKVNRV